MSRYYVQPQWLFDCVNARRLLPVEDYFVGAVLPPHISPFVTERPGDYIPPEKQMLLAQEQGLALSGNCVQHGTSFFFPPGRLPVVFFFSNLPCPHFLPEKNELSNQWLHCRLDFAIAEKEDDEGVEKEDEDDEEDDEDDDEEDDSEKEDEKEVADKGQAKSGTVKKVFRYGASFSDLK